jgi:DNA-binding transcriptional regulator LsrR (DeoR family)
MEDIQNPRKELLVEISKKYYIENMSQQQIAKDLHMSRSNISRLLKTCIDNKIVEIKINDVLSKEPELALQIKKAFNLKDVLIAASNKSVEKCRENVGALAAFYLQKVLDDNMLLGVTLGRTSYYVAHYIEVPGTKKVDVIQLVGGISGKTIDTDGQEITKRLARKLNGNSYILHAPHMVKTKLLKDLLMQEPGIASHYERFKEINVALVGIGYPRLYIGSQVTSGALTKADSIQLLELGAIADICGKYFDINGKTCNAGINERAIAIDLDTLKTVPVVVGVAAGLEKVKSCVSVLRSGYINVLIIDEVLAKGLFTML